MFRSFSYYFKCAFSSNSYSGAFEDFYTYLDPCYIPEVRSRDCVGLTLSYMGSYDYV